MHLDSLTTTLIIAHRLHIIRVKGTSHKETFQGSASVAKQHLISQAIHKDNKE